MIVEKKIEIIRLEKTCLLFEIRHMLVFFFQYHQMINGEMLLSKFISPEIA